MYIHTGETHVITLIEFSSSLRHTGYTADKLHGVCAEKGEGSCCQFGQYILLM